MQKVIVGEGYTFSDAVIYLNDKIESHWHAGWRPEGPPFTNHVDGASGNVCAVMQVLVKTEPLEFPRIDA